MNRKSFTLIEILSAIAIILILAALLIAGASFASRASAEARTRSLLKQMQLALSAYYQDRGYYPADDGTHTIDWPRSAFTSTTGVPYLPNYNPKDESNFVYRDAWGQPFHYLNDPTEGYKLWSNGYDKQNGTQDDITSWTR